MRSRLCTSILTALLCFSALSFAAPSPDDEIILDDGTSSTIDVQISVMPKLINFVKADYPDSLLSRNIEGVVGMDILVSDSGTVDSIAIVQGVHPALDSAAFRTVKKFRFTPAFADTTPVTVLLRYEYRFSVDQIISEMPIADSVNFSGKLLEMGTRAPIRDAMVVIEYRDTTADNTLRMPFTRYLEKIGKLEGQYLEENRLVAISDSTGHFSFKGIPAGKIRTSVILTGYSPFTETEIIVHGKTTDVIYRCERQSYSEYDITVYGKLPKKEVAQRTLNIEEIKRVPGFGGDAVKVIQAMPGVARPFFGLGELIVRGANDADNNYSIDGVYVPYVYHFGGLKSAYNSEALSGLDFYPGGFGVRYGNATSAVIELKTRPPKKDRWHGYVDVNLFDLSCLYEQPITPKLSIMASARRSHIADVISGTLKFLGVKLPFTTAPYYWDYLGRVDFTPTNKHRLFATAFSTYDKLELITSEMRGGSPSIGAANKLTAGQGYSMQYVGWDYIRDSLLSNQFRAGVAKYDETGNGFGYFDYSVKTTAGAIRDQITWKYSPQLTLAGGCDIRIIPIDLKTKYLDWETKAVTKLDMHFDLGPWAAYAFLEYRPNTKLLLIPGIRYDYYPELKYSGSMIPEFWNYSWAQNTTRFSGEPSVRLTGRYTLSSEHTLKGSLGTYNETPQPMGQVISEKVGNPNLPATKGAQYVAGWEWQINSDILLDVQAYYNRQWDRPRSTNNKDPHPELNYIGDGQARMKGLEFLLRHNQNSRFFGWIAYSLARSERYDYINQKWVLFSRDITNNLQIIGSWKLPHNMEAGFRLRYTDGNPIAPIEGIKFYDMSYFYYEPNTLPWGTARMSPYYGLDGRIEKKWIYKDWILTGFFEPINMLHLFKYVKKKDGTPLVEIPETNDYIEAFDYDPINRNVLSDIPRFSAGILAEF